MQTEFTAWLRDSHKTPFAASALPQYTEELLVLLVTFMRLQSLREDRLTQFHSGLLSRFAEAVVLFLEYCYSSGLIGIIFFMKLQHSHNWGLRTDLLTYL